MHPPRKFVLKILGSQQGCKRVLWVRGNGPRELIVEKKSQWADELRELIPKPPCRDRPFVCDGLPELCDVVVIGENPAQIMNSDWWGFWDVNRFNFGKFEKAYKEARLANNEPTPFSKTLI